MKAFRTYPARLAIILFALLLPRPGSAQIGDARPGAATSGNDPASLFAKGTHLLRIGNLEPAAAAFQAVLRLDPFSAAAHSNLGVIAMRQKHWENALAQLRQAQRLDPSLTGVRLNTGLVYYRMNDFASAEPEFAYLLAHEPASEQARYLLGLSSFFADHYQSALESLLPLWPRQSGSLTYLYVLGSAAHKANDEQVSIRAFQQMATAGQGTPEFHLYAGKASLGKQEYARAEEELTTAIVAKPDLPMAHFFLAQAYSAEHQDQKARDALREEIRLEPDVAFSYDELGRIEQRLGDSGAASSAFHAALARDSTLSTAYAGLAQIYRDKHEYERSLAMLDEAIKHRLNSGSLHYLRGQVLSRLHREIEARVEFHSAEVLLHTFNEQLKSPDATSRAADAQTTQQSAQE